MKSILPVVIDLIAPEHIVGSGDVEAMASSVTRRLVRKSRSAPSAIMMDLTVNKLVIVGGKAVIITPP